MQQQIREMFNMSLPRRTIVHCGIAAIASIIVMSWLRIRPLGVVFLAILGFWFYQTRCNFRLIAPPELQKKYQQFVKRLVQWRQTQPAMFCIVTSTCLGSLAIIGHLISCSTVVLAGLVIAAIISTRYNFRLVKIEHKDFAWSEKLMHDSNELDDEFIPDVNETNLFVLERASDLATISSRADGIDDDGEEDEEKSDEIPSELLIPDAIPEIDENSTDDDEHDDLVPVMRRQLINGGAPKTALQLHYENMIAQQETPANYMHFRKGHFKSDSSLSTSSSSSEESLSKGLQFPDHTTVVDGASGFGSKRQLTVPPLAAAAAATTITAAAAVSAGHVSMDADAARIEAGSPPLAVSTVPPSPQYNQDAGDIVAMAVKAQTQVLFANSGKLLPTLVSGLVQWGMAATGASTGAGAGTAAPPDIGTKDNTRRVVTALDSSDDSDFEILETEDFK